MLVPETSRQRFSVIHARIFKTKADEQPFVNNTSRVLMRLRVRFMTIPKYDTPVYLITHQ